MFGKRIRVISLATDHHEPKIDTSSFDKLAARTSPPPRSPRLLGRRRPERARRRRRAEKAAPGGRGGPERWR